MINVFSATLSSLTENTPLFGVIPNVYSTNTYNSFGQVGLWQTVHRPIFAAPILTGISGTVTPHYIDIDGEFSLSKSYYFTAKEYEKKYDLKSSEMFKKWKIGELAGPVYTEWVNAYLNIWDKVYES